MVLLSSIFLFLSVSVWYVSLEVSNLVEYKFVFDWMSLAFVITVSVIALGVFYFSKKYMEGVVPMSRFEKILLLFVLSMYVLIGSKNLILSLVGWDGLGLASVLLVMFYYSKSSLSAGVLTLTSNRLGDSALILATASTFCFVGSASLMGDNKIMLFTLLLYMAAATKGAQAPFSAWLPAAMAAPTPVSALVHSSTLVTAGVFLLMRYSSSLEESGMLMSPTSSFFWALISTTVTLYMASSTAIHLYDMKKIIAHSTLSQMSLIFYTFFMGMESLAFFHLITHAFVKATLFLVSGYVISNNGGRQDLRSISYSLKEKPFLSFCLFLALSSLSGMWYLSVFYSKDLITDSMGNSPYGVTTLYLLFLSLSLTSWYSARLMKLLLCASGKVWVWNKDEPLKSPLSSLVSMACVSGASLLWWAPSYSFFVESSISGKLWVFLLLIFGMMSGWKVPYSFFFNSTDLLKVWMLTTSWSYKWMLKFSESISSQGFMLNMIIQFISFLWMKMKTHWGLNYLMVGGLLIFILLFF
nr:NADH dehydrogenase subunit 5 [Laemobothrion sp.]